jgi:membrane peptidoglycan carboxypeptidase
LSRARPAPARIIATRGLSASTILVAGVWVGNDDDSPMRRVVGGSLPAQIWKRFMTAAAPLLGGQGMQVSSAPEAAGPPGNASSAPASSDSPESAGSSEEPRAGMCDYEACARFYHSFHASDCTYQPYSGGPRQICEK